jgi:hypothetical protein
VCTKKVFFFLSLLSPFLCDDGEKWWSMAIGAGHVRAPKCSTVGQQQVVALVQPLFFHPEEEE